MDAMAKRPCGGGEGSGSLELNGVKYTCLHTRNKTPKSKDDEKSVTLGSLKAHKSHPNASKCTIILKPNQIDN
nr:hypothetical protein CFP56_18139 [Quercus suber]